MGFSWSLFFCQRQAERRLSELDILRESRLVTDRSGASVFRLGETTGALGAPASPKIRFHYAYVDNLGALSEDPKSVAAFVQDVKTVFSGAGLDIHETEVMVGGGVTLGTVVDGAEHRTDLT